MLLLNKHSREHLWFLIKWQLHACEQKKKTDICLWTKRMWKRGMRQSTMKCNWPKRKGHVCVHSVLEWSFLKLIIADFNLKCLHVLPVMVDSSQGKTLKVYGLISLKRKRFTAGFISLKNTCYKTTPFIHRTFQIENVTAVNYSRYMYHHTKILGHHFIWQQMSLYTW